ncbi:MAG: hemerythrin domain-containing protein [Candidatus Thiodiazotropha sp.]
MPIEDFETRLLLDMQQMDDTHREFVDLLNRLDSATKDEFISLFPTLIEHTRAHFDAEQRLMEESRFPATGEHRSDHQRVMGDLTRFGERVAAGSTAMGRAYVREQLPQWFEIHVQTMDSALAVHLKYTRERLPEKA